MRTPTTAELDSIEANARDRCADSAVRELDLVAEIRRLRAVLPPRGLPVLIYNLTVRCACEDCEALHVMVPRKRESYGAAMGRLEVELHEAGWRLDKYWRCPEHGGLDANPSDL